MINSRKIEDLNPEAQKKCRDLIRLCENIGLKVLVISTLRDSEYQASLYAQGRTKPGKIITRCDGIRKKSKHQLGTAFDIVPVDNNGKILWGDSEKFRKIADLGISLGLSAGFYFKSFRDSPHFEIKE